MNKEDSPPRLATIRLDYLVSYDYHEILSRQDPP